MTTNDKRILPFKAPDPDAEAYARAETDRKQAWFAWADALLQRLGLTACVAQATSLEELRKVTFDPNDTVINLAIQDALNPISGSRAKHFVGLSDKKLLRILATRLNDLKHERQAQLLGRTQRPHDWSDDLTRGAFGQIRPLLSNVILFLRHHPAWESVLAFDEFHLHVVLHRRPYWGEAPLDQKLNDHHETLIRTWFESEEDLVVSQANVGRAVQAAARFNCLHPVRDYLNGLVDDGTSGLDTWLIDYLGAPDTPYIRAVGPRILIGAVARIYRPGCQADNLPTLEGPQGIGKSSAWRRLSEPWFTDRVSALASKDAAQEMAGVWFIEVAEFEAIFRATTGTAKAFISRLSDRYRPPYAKHVIDQPRQSFLVSSINPPDGGYLVDSTGSRRIWPITCGAIDLAGLTRARDQLFAQAITRFKAGATWWLETPELEALATVEQAARFKTDIWETPIKEWLGDRKETSIQEILKEVLGHTSEKPDHKAELRVQKILAERLHFDPVHTNRRGPDGKRRREHRYHRD